MLSITFAINTALLTTRPRSQLFCNKHAFRDTFSFQSTRIFLPNSKLVNVLLYRSAVCPTFFDSRAILAHQKYWRSKQTIHFNFSSRDQGVLQKKKKRSSLEFSFILFNFRPKIKVFSKKKSSPVFSFIFFKLIRDQICTWNPSSISAWISAKMGG